MIGNAIALKAASGATVTIGDFRAAGAAPATTWGEPIRVMDPGVPLSLYNPSDQDPMAIWKEQPSVRKVVGFAARHLAAVPWHVHRRVSDTDRQRLAGGTAETLLNSPARFRSGYNLWETVMVDKLLYDRWAVMYWKGQNGERDRLLRIPPKLLVIESDFLGQPTKVLLRNPQAGEPDIDLTDAPIAVSWGWSDQAAGGVSPMTTLRNLLRENKRAIEWREDLWMNGPKVSGVLKHPQSFKTDQARDRLVESWGAWRQRQQGTPILENGIEYQQLDTVTPKDARDIEGRTLTDIEVAGAYYIPPEMVGSREGTMSNIQAFRTMLYGPTLGPYFSDIHQAVNAGLMPYLGGADEYAEQDRDKASQGSVLERAKVYQVLVGGPVMTRNEARAEMNLPRVEGGDELITPMNVTSGGQANPQDSGTQNEGTGDTETESETPQ